MREQTVVTHRKEETQALGESMGKTLSYPTTILLFGELGSGKTTFVQGLTKGLGITQRIISPTFIIVRTYNIKGKSQKAKVKSTIQNPKFYHIDLYRIENAQDVQGLGLKEILEDSEAIAVIEWAEKMGSLQLKQRWDITFDHVSENERKISIRKISN